MPAQVRYAFLAGLAVVILLIPVNRWLAGKIEGASERMMAHKDARLQIMGELLKGIHQVKLSAWEPRFIRKVSLQCASTLTLYTILYHSPLWWGTRNVCCRCPILGQLEAACHAELSAWDSHFMRKVSIAFATMRGAGSQHTQACTAATTSKVSSCRCSRLLPKMPCLMCEA